MATTTMIVLISTPSSSGPLISSKATAAALKYSNAATICTSKVCAKFKRSSSATDLFSN